MIYRKGTAVTEKQSLISYFDYLRGGNFYGC